MESSIKKISKLQDLPNVEPAIAAKLRTLGIDKPSDLPGLDPYVMYAELNSRTGQRHDPCLLDVFISVVRFMEGAPAKPWWEYTAVRKQRLRSLT